ncbi:MAG: hypothetical protein ACR2PO_08565 [Methyloligellaceae bacterium]
MSERFKLKLSRIRDIAWSIWDPIGLRGLEGDWPDDEYDTYVLRAAGMIRNGHSLKVVADYLVEIEEFYMGLGRKSDTRKRAEQTAKAIRQYLDELPDGPLRVR